MWYRRTKISQFMHKFRDRNLQARVCRGNRIFVEWKKGGKDFRDGCVLRDEELCRSYRIINWSFRLVPKFLVRVLGQSLVNRKSFVIRKFVFVGERSRWFFAILSVFLCTSPPPYTFLMDKKISIQLCLRWCVFFANSVINFAGYKVSVFSLIFKLICHSVSTLSPKTLFLCQLYEFGETLRTLPTVFGRQIKVYVDKIVTTMII